MVLDDSQNNTRQHIAQLALDFAGVYYALVGAKAKLISMAKLCRCPFILEVFAQSMAIGFENRMGMLVNHPSRVEIDEAGMVRNPLQEIHSSIQQSILERATGVGKYFLDAFDLAMRSRVEKIQAMNKRLLESAITGSDFVFIPAKNMGAIGKRFRVFSTIKYNDDKCLNPSGADKIFKKLLATIYSGSDYIPAFLSALGSTAFIAIDSLGRFLGENIAKSVFGFFNILPSTLNHPEYIGYAQKAILAMLCLYKDFFSVVDQYWGKMYNVIYNTLYYPIVSGLLMGLYEEIQADYPDILRTTQQEAVVSNIHGNKTLEQIITTSFQRAEYYYGKYDKMLLEGKSDERIKRTLIENFTSSKRYLEARHALLSIMEKNKFVSTCLLSIKPIILAVQAVTSKLLFDISKITTKQIYHHVAKNLGASLTKAISEKEESIANKTGTPEHDFEKHAKID